MAIRDKYRLAWGRFGLDLGQRTLIMGVLNVTPDSFSDGGRFFEYEAAVAQGEKLAADGADIIDIGGESTRPFSDAVPVEEEIRRVVPVIERLAERVKIPISIDTMKASVARRAIEAGAAMINDVTALRFDPELAGLAAELDVPVILMHMLGDPKTMQKDPAYDDLVAEIRGFLADAVDRATAAGIRHSNIIIDPGIGFGKTLEHNLLLIKHLHAFSALDVPVLIGSSRKAFIRKLLKDDNVPDIPADLPAVENGTQATVAASILNGAHIVRVHDVAKTVVTAKIVDSILGVE